MFDPPGPRFQFAKFLSLIRAMFPRWSFFDRVAHNYELQFKVQDALGWESVSFSQRRRALGLFVNPVHNLALAEVNILEHFVSDIHEMQGAQGLVESQKVTRLATFKMLRSLLGLKLTAYDLAPSSIQFKIVAVSEAARDDIFISDWIHLGE